MRPGWERPGLLSLERSRSWHDSKYGQIKGFPPCLVQKRVTSVTAQGFWLWRLKSCLPKLVNAVDTFMKVLLSSSLEF